MRNIPNIVTLLRLALAPFAVRALLAGDYRLALGIFAMAGVTDALDGYLARRLNAKTRFGAYLDPIADKLLLSATYVALGAAHLVPWWLVAVVFGRDLVILALAGLALLFTTRRDFPPSFWGKLSTVFQVFGAIGIITSRAFPTIALPQGFLVCAIAGATGWSGVAYVWQAVRLAVSLRRAGSSNRDE